MSNTRRPQKFVSPRTTNTTTTFGTNSTTGSRFKRQNSNETVIAGTSFRKPTPGSKKPGETPFNASICINSTNASSRIRRNLNETICSGQSMPSVMRKPALAPKKGMENENAKLQIMFAYNEYLQSLMKQLIVEEKIKKNQEILDGQQVHYRQLLNTKKKQLDDVVNDTKTLEKQKQVSLK